MSSRSGLATWLLAGCLLGAIVAPVWVVADARAASPIYDWAFYKKYQPNGTSVIQVPVDPGQPGTPPTEPPSPPTPAPSQDLSEAERLLALLNAERARRGVGPLELDPTLSQMAAAKASYMVASGYANHYVPGYTYPGLAENLTGAPNVQFAHSLLLASPSHARAMLDPRYTEVGIGVVPAKNGGVLVIELFR